MAEVAPLNSAHAHVRKATDDFRKTQWAQAAEEHQQASTDFARAARGTNDAEALRVLKLLEEQHHKLAQIIKTQDSSQNDSTDNEPKDTESPAGARDASPKAPSSSTTEKPSNPPTQSRALATARIGTQQRDSSPSLAREIASRRGIPQPTRSAASPAAQARARQLSPESSRRALSNHARESAPTPTPPDVVAAQQARRAKKAAADEGFAKFYSSLATGTMSRLSSVLAYTGLPLTAEDTSATANTASAAASTEQLPSSSRSKGSKRTVSAESPNDPDVKKYISKAALAAIEDEHRKRGTLGHGFGGPAESFYVVQKGGGTYSYADIARTHHNQLATSSPTPGGGAGEDEEPEFVDAREAQTFSPHTPTPQASAIAPSASTRSAFGNPRTNEELDLENATLKQTLTDLAARLSAFEAHAQDASFAALTQSVATLRPPPSTPGAGAAGTQDAALAERIRQLEQQVEEQAEERQRLEGVAGKQERLLKKYQGRFEEIKKSAREKERVKREKAAAVEEAGGGKAAEGEGGES